MNLSKNLEYSALFFPNRPAIIDASAEITYAEFNEKSNCVATALIQLGIKPGDHIGLLAPNSPEWLIFYFGVLKTGAVAVTFSSMLKGAELSLLISHAKPKYIFTHDEKMDELIKLRQNVPIERIISNSGDIRFKELLDMGVTSFRAVERNRTDTAAILYTGGTTGTPKGVMLSHENINMAIHNVVFYERSNENDRALLFLPLNHVFGQIHIMHATVLSGGCVEMIPAFELDRVLEVLEKGQVTKFFSVPTIYVRLLTVKNLREKLSSIRYCFSAAASMAGEIVKQWKKETGLSIHESYGMTETATMVTYNHYHQHVVGSVGTEVHGVEAEIRDEHGNKLEVGTKGEICVRGRNVMNGYLDNPEATQAAFWEGGWFRSGDIGVFDEKGYLYIVDRLKDMIITGGENVYSREVEEVLYTYPDVQECAVIGLPDVEWGERVSACIIPKEGTSISDQKIKNFMKSKLSAFKIPKAYFILNDFPKNPAGKILKRTLRDQMMKIDKQ